MKSKQQKFDIPNTTYLPAADRVETRFATFKSINDAREYIRVVAPNGVIVGVFPNGATKVMFKIQQ